MPRAIMTTGSASPSNGVRRSAPRMPAPKMARLKATGRNALATSAFSPPAVVSGALELGLMRRRR